MQICDKCKTPSVYFIYSFSVTWTLTRRKTRKVLKVCRWIFMSLSPPPRPLRVVGKLGRMNWQRKRVEHNGKGKETEAPAFPSSYRPPRAFFFSSIAECIFISFYWDIHRSRVSAESRVQVVLCPGRLNILKVWAVLFDVLVLALVFGNVFLFAFLVSYIVDNHCILYF